MKKFDLVPLNVDHLADFLEENPETWCQGHGAIDEEGAAVNPLNPDAVKWCLWGFGHKFHISYFDIYARIGESLVTWNDAPGRTVQDVIAKLREKAAAPSILETF